MPVFNLTLDDSSPMIVYDGAWSDSLHSDPDWQDYSQGTFHATQELDDTATFSFHGAAVYLFGAFRINHNDYTVTLDGQQTTSDGLNTGPPTFQQVMFGAEGLDLDQQHQISLQNTFKSPAAPFVDLDYITITDGDGNAQTQSVDKSLDDDDSSIQYSSGWTTMQQEGYYQSSMHRTNGKGNSATMTFHGNAITVYGGTNTDHGLFSVSVDGGSAQTFNGTAPALRTGIVLYYASGLSNDQHKLVITNVDDNGGWLDLDEIVVSDWSGSNTSPSTSSSSSHGSGTTILPPPPHSQGGAGSTATSSSTVLPSATTPTSSSGPSTSSIQQTSQGGSTFAAPVPLSGQPTASASAPIGSSSGISAIGASSDTSSQSSTKGPIIGGALGGAAILVLVCGILWYYLRPRRPSYPSAMVPPAFKTSSWEDYRDHYARGTPPPPPDVRELPPVEHSTFYPAGMPGQPLPQPPSNAATGGYDTTIRTALATPVPPHDRRNSLTYSDITRLRSPPPTYSQAGSPPSAHAAGHPEPYV